MYATTNWTALSRLSSLREFRLFITDGALSMWIKPLRDILNALILLPSITQLNFQTNWRHREPHELTQLIDAFEMYWKNDGFLPLLQTLIYQVGAVTPAHMSMIMTRSLVTLSMVILPVDLLDRTQWKLHQITTDRECHWHRLRTLDVTVAVDHAAVVLLNQLGRRMMADASMLVLDPLCPNLLTLRLNWQAIVDYFETDLTDHSVLPVMRLFLSQSLQEFVINDIHHSTIADSALQYINQLRSLVHFTLILTGGQPEAYVFASDRPFINAPAFLSLKSLTVKSYSMLTMQQLESFLLATPHITWLSIDIELECTSWACPLPLIARLCTHLRHLSLYYFGRNDHSITLTDLQQAFSECRLDAPIFSCLQSLSVPIMSLDALHWLLCRLACTPLAYFTMRPKPLHLGSLSTVVDSIPPIRLAHIYVALQRLLPHLRQIVWLESDLWTVYCQHRDHVDNDNAPVSPFNPSCDPPVWRLKSDSMVPDLLAIAETRNVHRLYDAEPRFRVEIDEQDMDGWQRCVLSYSLSSNSQHIRVANPGAMGSRKILATLTQHTVLLNF